MADTPIEPRRVVALVRQSGRAGCTRPYIERMTGGTSQAVKACLDLQVQAGIMTATEEFDGERYIGWVYRIREGM